MKEDFLDKLFLKARSHYNWQDKDVDIKVLESLYNLVKNCPTSANSEPMRIVFLKSNFTCWLTSFALLFIRLLNLSVSNPM